MPTYDYRCEDCGYEFEEMQSFSADPLKTCPKCGKDTLRRLFGTGAAILFKGGGFYETDYRSDGYKKAEKADSTASAPAAKEGDKSASTNSGSGAKSESAPAKSSPDAGK